MEVIHVHDLRIPKSVFGVTAGHERGRLFVPHLNEPDIVLSFAQRFHDAVNAIAGKPENYIHPPFVIVSIKTSAAVVAIFVSFAEIG